MPLLTPPNDGDSPIDASQIQTYYNLLTGVTQDQPVSLRNRLSVGGNQASSDNVETIVGVVGQTGLLVRILKAIGDANPSYGVDVNGKVAWGPGGASATDTTLERAGVGLLKGNGAFVEPQIATPSAPGAGLGILYTKADGNWYTRAGAAGAETAIGGTNTTDPLVMQTFG